MPDIRYYTDSRWKAGAVVKGLLKVSRQTRTFAYQHCSWFWTVCSCCNLAEQAISLSFHGRIISKVFQVLLIFSLAAFLQSLCVAARQSAEPPLHLWSTRVPGPQGHSVSFLYYLQNGALLATLHKLHTFQGTGHIAVFNTLAIGHTKHSAEQRVPSFAFAVSRLRALNRQDFVFILPPGISHGAFQLQMVNVWFWKVLLLFEIESKSDIGFERHSGSFVSVMEEYNRQLRLGT